MAEQEQAKSAEDQPQFALQRLYLKDISFESPNSPEVFRQQWSPKVKLDVTWAQRRLQTICMRWY